jgi:hypothetical protein
LDLLPNKESMLVVAENRESTEDASAQAFASLLEEGLGTGEEVELLGKGLTR